MTRTQRIEPVADREDWRRRSAELLGDFSTLAGRPWSELSRHEIFPGNALGDTELVVPASWMPGGVSQRLSSRTLRPEEAGMPDDVVVGSARNESIRRAILALSLPHATETGVRQWKPNSWLTNCRRLFEVASWQLRNRPSETGSVFSHLTFADIHGRIIPEVGGAGRKRDYLRHLFQILIDAGQRGMLADYPKIYAEAEADAPPLEDSYQGSTPVAPAQKAEQRSWQPFADEFVTELMRRALWFQRELSPALLECWKESMRLAKAQSRPSHHPEVIRIRSEFIRSYDWRDSRGRPISKLPWVERSRDVAEANPTLTWPPKDARSVNKFVTLLQTLNICTIAFCTGARSGEIADARDVGEAAASPDRLVSRTFKLIDNTAGLQRDWPLHPAAQAAYHAQCQLARAIRPEGTDFLWVTTGDAKVRPLLNLTEPIVQAVKQLGLTHLCGEDRAHMHRWRHTVARLVAVSVVGAPQVLLDLFGHRDLEMTLHYMLSDPDIVEDAMRVARETAFVEAKQAVEDTMDGVSSGPAASPLREGLEDLRMRTGQERFDAQSLTEAIDVLTFSSKHWELVRPGVLCTKTIGQFGPCTRRRGSPDPASCRTDCTHRLESARAKRHCEGALKTLLAELESARSEEMVAASLEGQILAHMKRWPDVTERVVKENSEARRIWETRHG